MAAKGRKVRSRPQAPLGCNMKKTKKFYIWKTLLASLLIFIFTGCGLPTFNSTPTAPPPYLHYTPSEGLDVHLEFDYPSSWTITEEKFKDSSYLFVGLGDPQLLTLPTRAPNEPHGTPSDFGRISILIRPVNPGQTLEELIKPHKQGYASASWITQINNYKLTIDGIDAIAFEYQVDPILDNGFTSLMFERTIFFIVKDQFYEVTFIVAEKDRDGEFEQGHEIFFNSLKIAP